MAIGGGYAWLALAPALISATHADIRWWHSEAGNVTEYRDGKSLTCTLALNSDQGEFQFMWSDSLPPYAIVQRPDWTLPLNHMATASLRIGDTWLTTADGSRNLPALTEPHGLMFLLDQPVQNLLKDAQDLALQTPDRTFELKIPHPRMQPLVKALRRCMAQTRIAEKPG